jgi:hypothetical protein
MQAHNLALLLIGHLSLRLAQFAHRLAHFDARLVVVAVVVVIFVALVFVVIVIVIVVIRIVVIIVIKMSMLRLDLGSLRFATFPCCLLLHINQHKCETPHTAYTHLCTLLAFAASTARHRQRGDRSGRVRDELAHARVEILADLRHH